MRSTYRGRRIGCLGSTVTGRIVDRFWVTGAGKVLRLWALTRAVPGVAHRRASAALQLLLDEGVEISLEAVRELVTPPVIELWPPRATRSSMSTGADTE